jgi:phosphomevalonate kinase
MAKSKRPAFQFPELESRGRHTILRSTQEVAAELDVLQRAEEEPKERVKVTYRFQAEAVEAVEDIRRILRRQHGVRKVNREDIAQAAVLEALHDLETNGHASFLAREFGER